MPRKRVVYTVLTGGYETLLEQPAAIGCGVDLVCLTDDASLRSPHWQVRHVPRALPSDPVRSARRMKILTQDYLAEYDESLYIDNAVLLTAAPDAVFDALLPPDAVMALLRHSFRGPLRDEFAAVVEQSLDAGWVCEEQKRHYEQTDPAGLEAPTLASGILLRRHGDPALQAVMRLWWENVLRYSRRDQLSLPIALRTATFSYKAHSFDNHRSPFHEWPHWVGKPTRPGRIAAPSWPDRRIAELEGAVAERGESISELEGVVAELTADLGRLNGEQIRSEALAAERDELRAENARLLGCLDELRGSTSWRLTEPARALSGAIRLGRVRRRELPRMTPLPGAGG